jgi:menaquinone-dependent protoporphyrinogen oxidase
MSRLLILYASVDGQAGRIAERIGGVLASAGHAVITLQAGEPGLIQALEGAEAAIVGGSIRYGHHPRALEALVRTYRDSIAGVPNAFFSVSLSAGGPGARPATATSYVDEFIKRTGWRPRHAACFAGALRYTRYNPFTRFMMRLIVGAAGGETDASRDYEYTDWAAVDRFGAAFAGQLEPSGVTPG